MLTRFRRNFRLQTIAMFLAVMVSGGTMEWAHGGWDDPGCDPVPIHHDHAAHRVAAGTRGPAAPLEHCALCHLLSSLRTARSAESLATDVAASAESRRPVDGTFTIALVALAVPARAPPAILL